MNSSQSKKEKNKEINVADELIIQSLARLDSVALGISIGTLLGLVIFLATNFLIFKGGEQIGPRLALLNQYFIGYEVTVFGSFIGLIYGFLTGFIFGWLSATIRNIIVTLYIHFFKFKGKMSAVNDFIDNP